MDLMTSVRSKRLAEFVAQGEDALRFLTPDQEQIVRLLAEGKTGKEVGAHFAKSDSAIRRVATKAEQAMMKRERVRQQPKDRHFALVRIFHDKDKNDGWGGEVKSEVVWQGTKQDLLKLYPPTVDSPGMQMWLQLGTNGTLLFFEERYDVCPGSYEKCGDPRFI